MPMETNKKYWIIPYPSEHVIVDRSGKKVVACPTEQEARDYIGEVLKGETAVSPFVNGGMDSEDSER